MKEVVRLMKIVYQNHAQVDLLRTMMQWNFARIEGGIFVSMILVFSLTIVVALDVVMMINGFGLETEV